MGGEERTTVNRFKVFCAKAFAGIGNLPDTVADRSIPLRLRRRAPEEQVKRFRLREVSEQAQPLRDLITHWANQADGLAASRPQLPPELSDRAQDIWEPLFAIADQAAGAWPERARRAALALSAGEEVADDSHGIQLLTDIHSLFEDAGVDRFLSADLAWKLASLDESPWGDLNGRTLDQRKLARLLKPYGIRSTQIRIGETTSKGYRRDHFQDAWNRYTPHLSRNNRNIPANKPFLAANGSETGEPLFRSETAEKPLNQAVVSDVSPNGGGSRPAQLPGAPCSYPIHRGSEWINDSGRQVRGECHPPTKTKGRP
jgi:hypothetical protein